MFEIFSLAALLCVIGAVVSYIKEKLTPEIPAENWANKDLKHEDIMNGVPMKQIIKNARDGKYKIDEVGSQIRRDKHGNIVIENRILYKEDMKRYGTAQVYEWVKQGKYNQHSKEK